MEQTVKILSEDVGELPGILFSYFDPDRGEYVTISRGPFPIKIKAAEPSRAGITAKERGRDQAGLAIREDKKPKEALVEIRTHPGPIGRINPYLYSGPLPLATQLFPVLLILVSMIIKNRMNFLESDQEYASWLRMLNISAGYISRAGALLRRRRSKEFYDHVFLSMQNYLGARLMIHPEGITEKTVDEVLGGDIIDDAILGTIKKIFSDCHIARFTSNPMSDDDMRRTLDYMKKVIAYLNGRTYLLK